MFNQRGLARRDAIRRWVHFARWLAPKQGACLLVEYTIPAIPTVYRGRQYRSRLESRWAAFFDLLGWQHEYEPCDLGPWSPDFFLWGRRQNDPVFVEVKPITTWCRETARKMADTFSPLDGLCPYLLLLGSQPPDFGSRGDPEDLVGVPDSYGTLGWLGKSQVYEAEWTEALLGTDTSGRIDLLPNGWGIGFQGEGVLWGGLVEAVADNSERMWKQAANVVQWKGPRS
jgi:hypothetical protein